MTLFKKLIYFICLLLTATSNEFIAQEQLHPLSANRFLPAIKSSQLSSKITTTVTLLNLPFFEDFSYAYKSPYPSFTNWMDSNVYVNTGFPIAPINLGVATFDGLNKLGYPYNISAPVSYSENADKLTSRPINLEVTSTNTFSPADSIFMTFYYQAEGRGEAPEMDDSLCLDFFAPNLNKWNKVWGVKGYNPSATDTNFYRVRVPITNTIYLDSLFQFRFRNKATTSGSLDHWHLDFIQIKKNYSYLDTMPLGLEFAQMPSSFLKNYSVIPYRQYVESTELDTIFRNYIRNNDIGDIQADYRYTITDKLGTPVPTDPIVTIPFPGVNPFLNAGYYNGFAGRPKITIKPFAPSFTDSAFYTITHYIKNGSDTSKLVHVQKFTNYYAYDDGTAEQGYYLNTYGAKTAVRFKLNVLDTLKSVRIYFDPITQGNLIKSASFRLFVWTDTGNGPGSVLYKDSLMYPDYISGGYNLQPTYDLTSCLPLNSGTYYIGLQQTTNQPLNIGFDKNTNHKDALYYNISGSWAQSAIPGSIMINPVMGCVEPPVVIGINEYTKKDIMSIFPNPAQNTITVKYPGNQITQASIQLVSALGDIVLEQSIISNDQIDISNISNGLYFIHIKGNGLNVSSKKLIISR
jgi:hypothetical protein